MNVLFLNPYIYDFTAFDLWIKPLGLLQLAAVAKQYSSAKIYWLDALDRFTSSNNHKGRADGRGKFNREFVKKPELYRNVPRNYARYGISLEDFHNQLKTLPDINLVFVTSLMTYWIDGLDFTIDLIKKKFPKSKIVLGGILPSLYDHNLLNKRFKIDHMVSGYGEDYILQIISQYGGKIYNHPDFKNINNLPLPAVEYLGNKEVMPFLTSRGCPLKCTYCASHILNKKFLQRNPKTLTDQLFFYYNNYNTRHFIIFDDAFLINKQERILPVLKEFSRKARNTNFHIPNGVHAKEMDLETANLFFSAGFKTLRLSFESTSKKTLLKSSKKISIEQMIEAVENLVSAGYTKNQIGCYILFGAEWQNYEEILKSLDFVGKLGIKVYLSYYSPVPQTEDYLSLVKRGILKGSDFHETNKIYFVFEKSGLSLKEIQYIKQYTSNINNRNN